MTKLYLPILLMFSAGIVFACQSNGNSKLLLGHYVLNVSTNDSIFILADKRYIHKRLGTKGQIFENVGIWEYDSVNEEVLFKDFNFFTDHGTDELPPGNWYSRVLFTDRDVRLMYSTEDNIYFYKVN